MWAPSLCKHGLHVVDKTFAPQGPACPFMAMYGLHFIGRGQTFRVGRHGDEMHMIRHQAPGPDVDLVGLAPLGHQFDVGEVIIVAEKGLLTAIASQGDVMWIARGYYSFDSCHECHLSKPARWQPSRINILSPEFRTEFRNSWNSPVPGIPRGIPQNIIFPRVKLAS